MVEQVKKAPVNAPACACGREELGLEMITPQTRIQRIGYRTPDDVAEPEQPVLVEYVSGGRVALVTLNRPHADNAITTELAAPALGLGTTITGSINTTSQAYPPLIEALALPEGHIPYGTFVIGYPAEWYLRIPTRKPAEVMWH